MHKLRIQFCWPGIFIVLFFLIACNKTDKKDERSFNRLANASSPYLKEHADNPVDWYEWGPEALEKAKKEGKPLIVSVGYAACHWCHVMEEESFMDTAVANIMNKNFVSIKVDREERPDVDQIYITAAQLISGTAGWPLNAFALPDGKPFYAATYFPKSQWVNLLGQITRAYQQDRNNVLRQAESITKGIQTTDMIVPAISEKGSLNKAAYNSLFSKWQSSFDFRHGGLTGSPKFPMPVVTEFLLQNNYITGNKDALALAYTSLDAMATGGIYDQLAGGFARYATDSIWKVPHFEKMLYDNAQLVSLYSHAFQQSKNPSYETIVHQTLEFVKRELTSSEGGFYSSINADSEGEEGKYYVWTKSEIESLLSKELANLVIDYFQITDSGNWENRKNILYRQETSEELASKHSISIEQMDEKLAAARKTLLNARDKRIHPSLDDKVLTSWNALMLLSYTDAYLATSKKEYLDIALKNATFLEHNVLRNDGRLWRSYKDNKSSIEGFLDDYAFLAKAYIRLYEATFDLHWLDLARSVADYAVKHFQDDQSGLFYFTSDQSESLVARTMELTDQAVPASNSVLAEVLFRLGEYYDEKSYQLIAETMLNRMMKDINTNGPYYANWASLLGLMTQPYEVAVMGDDALTSSLIMQQRYLPLAIFMGGNKENLPLLENKKVAGKTMIYVCRNKVCKLPVDNTDEASQQFK